MGDLTKNFDKKEFSCNCCLAEGVNIKLVKKLQNIRDALGVPININSGYRCRKHNRFVGGSTNSSHMSGLAVDISCLSSTFRFNIISTALSEGIYRIGVYSDFIHLDIDAKKSQKVIWNGN